MAFLGDRCFRVPIPFDNLRVYPSILDQISPIQGSGGDPATKWKRQGYHLDPEV